MKFDIGVSFETDIDKVQWINIKTDLKIVEDEELGPMMFAPLQSQGVIRMEDEALTVRC